MIKYYSFSQSLHNTKNSNIADFSLAVPLKIKKTNHFRNLEKSSLL